MSIVACRCGGRFQADERLAGRQVKCPTCGTILVIPAVAPAMGQPPPQHVPQHMQGPMQIPMHQAPGMAPMGGGNDLFSLGDLSQFGGGGFGSGMPGMPGGPQGPGGQMPMQPGFDPLAGTLGAGPPGAPQGFPGQPMPQGGQPGWQMPGQLPGKPGQAAPAGMNSVVLFAIIGGVVTVALIVVIIVFANMGGGDSSVASSTPTSTSTTPGTTAGPPMGLPAGVSAPAPGSTSTPGATTSNPSAPGGAAMSPIGPAPIGPAPMNNPPVNTSASLPGAAIPSTTPTTASTPGAAAAGAATPATGPTLNVGAMAWYANAGNGLKGARMMDKAEDYDRLVYQRFSWMIELLPHLGHQEHYAKFKYDHPWSDNPNLQLAAKLIPQFLNPSDPRPRWKGYPINNIALTHFVGMSGVEDRRNVVAGTLPRSDPRAGVFGYDAIAKPEEITDGLSSTIAVLGSGELTGPWVQGGGATIRGAREPYFDDMTGFGSKGLSNKGVMAMFADGSVRTISADIDPQVFRAMCTIHGAETVDLGKLDLLPNGLPIGSDQEVDPPEESTAGTTPGSMPGGMPGGMGTPGGVPGGVPPGAGVPGGIPGGVPPGAGVPGGAPPGTPRPTGSP